MRGILLAVILAAGLALGLGSDGRAAPASGAAVFDAASAIQLAEQVHCRWDGAYHCHPWGCHYGCGVRRFYAVPYYRPYRFYYGPRRFYGHRHWRRR